MDEVVVALAVIAERVAVDLQHLLDKECGPHTTSALYLGKFLLVTRITDVARQCAVVEAQLAEACDCWQLDHIDSSNAVLLSLSLDAQSSCQQAALMINLQRPRKQCFASLRLSVQS